MGSTDDYIAKYMGIVDRGIASIPYRKMALWKEFFLNPTATLPKDDVGIVERLKDLYVQHILAFVITVIGIMPSVLVSSIANPAAGLVAVGVVILVLVLGYLLAPLALFVYSLLELLAAKLLGGTGDMRANFNASILPGLAVFVVILPIMIVEIPVNWLSAIPLIGLVGSCIGYVFSLIYLLGGLYIMYLKYLSFKQVHKLSDARAAGVVVLPFVILVGLAVVAVVALYALLFAVLLGGMAGMGGLYGSDLLSP